MKIRILAIGVLSFFLGASTGVHAQQLIIIEDNAVSTSGELIFDYQDIAPGFIGNTPIKLESRTDLPAQLVLDTFIADSSDPNDLLSSVDLSLRYADEVLARSSTGETEFDLLRKTLCLPARALVALNSRLYLPPTVDNVAQKTSLKVKYQLQVSVGACESDALKLEPTPSEPEETPSPSSSPSLNTDGSNSDENRDNHQPPPSMRPQLLPPAGESMSKFYFLGMQVLGSLTMIVICCWVSWWRCDFGASTKRTEVEENRQTKTIEKKAKWTGRIVNIFFITCLVIMASAVCYGVIVKRTGTPLTIFNHQIFVIASGSMEPTIKINSLVLVRLGGFEQVKLGDVVAFAAVGLNNRVSLHRVLAIEDGSEGKQLITKGDNNSRADGAPVTSTNYLGTAVGHSNLIATYLTALQRPRGWLQTVVLPLLALVLIYIAVGDLVGASTSGLGKIFSLSLITLVISGAIFTSYLVFTLRRIKTTNSTLEVVAQNFTTCGSNTTWKVGGQKVLGVIEIPKLNLHYPIISYLSATSLDIAITHFAGATLNGTGNSVLAGHRIYGQSSPFALFFTQLDQLNVGDEIYITDANCQRLKYKVTGWQTVTPDDVSVLDQPANQQKLLTLISCSYDLQNRFVVRAELAED